MNVFFFLLFPIAKLYQRDFDLRSNSDEHQVEWRIEKKWLKVYILMFFQQLTENCFESKHWKRQQLTVDPKLRRTTLRTAQWTTRDEEIRSTFIFHSTCALQLSSLKYLLEKFVRHSISAFANMPFMLLTEQKHKLAHYYAAPQKMEFLLFMFWKKKCCANRMIRFVRKFSTWCPFSYLILKIISNSTEMESGVSV